MKNAVRASACSGIALLASLTAIPAAAQSAERVRAADATLDCAGLVRESKALDTTIAAGDSNSNAMGRGAAGAAAGVGGQVAGSIVGSLFGPLGSVIGGQAANVTARQATESSMAPDAAARQRGTEAAERRDFLASVAKAKGCKADDPTFAGNALSPDEFAKLAEAGPLSKTTPLTLASVQPVLAESVSPYPYDGLLQGKLDLKDKRFYISEFRVLFDVGGRVTGRTRAGYIPGRDYGSTSARVNYQVPDIDVAAFQAITDRAYQDFLARAKSAGIRFEDAQAFTREHGVVYEATDDASRPGTPVFLEKSLGHSERKYLVMAPTGTKIHSRGFTGLGAGNMGKRMEWVRGKLEALSIGMTINIAALESSGSGSSIFRRGSSAEAKESMTVSQPPDSGVIQTHANTHGLQMPQALAVDGNFARFREAGGYDSSKDAVARTAGILSNLAGLGANQTKRVDLAVDLDGPSTARMSLKGIATVNQALVDQIKAGM